MKNIASELFQLMSSLSQSPNCEKVISSFTEAVNSYNKDLFIEFTYQLPQDGDTFIEIASNKKLYGYFNIKVDSNSVSPDFQSLVLNAIKLLPLILDEKKHEGMLSDEKQILKTIVDEKTKSIIESEKNYRILFDNLEQGVFYQRADGSHIEINKAALKMLGISKSEFLERTSNYKSWFIMDEKGELLAPEEFPSIIALTTGKQNNKLIKTINETTQKDVWIEINAIPVFNDTESTPYQVVVTLTDITKQKKAEEELNLKSLVLDQIRDNVTITDLNGIIIDVNNAEVETIGHPREYLIGKPIQIYGEDNLRGNSQNEIIENTLQLGNWRGEVVNYTSDGKEVILDCRTSVIYDENGKKIAMCGVASDVSEQKKAENKINNLLERLNLAAKASKLGIWDWDIQNDFMEWDERMLELYGINGLNSTINIKEWLNFIHPEDKKIFSETFDNALHGTGVYDSEYKIVLTDGSVKFIKANGIVLKDKDGNAIRITGVNYDITEQKQAEIERNAMIDLFSLINNTANKKDLIHEVTGFIKKYLKCEAVGIRVKVKTDYPYYETSGFAEEFVKSENSLCAVDLNNKIICDFRGMPMLECMCGSIINGRFDAAKPFFTQHGSFWTNSTTSLFTENNDNEKSRRNRCNGAGYESVGLFPLKVGSTTFGLLQINDRRKGLFNINTIKILERISDALAISLLQYQTFDALLESEQIHREILRTALDGFWRIDLTGKILEVNQAWCNMSGYTEEEMKTKYVQDIEIIESPEDTLKHINKLIVEGGTRFETRHRCKNGNIIDVEISSSYSPLDQGQLFSFISDISQRKQNEEAMRVSNERYKQSEFDLKIAQSVAHLGSWKWNVKTGDILLSDEMYIILGIDKNIKLNMISTALCEVMHPDDLHFFYPENLSQILKQKHVEFRIILPNGSLRWISVEAGENYYDNEGNRTYMTGIAQDITERKFTEEQLKSSLKDKEVLIRELYHRTKNNMQVICAILKLKASSINDQNTISILNEMENRIRSMALVHQKLYQSQNLSKVNLKEYISELTDLLMRSYKTSAEKIKLILDLEKVEVLIDSAIPCGLVINELVSNSLKYAFPEDLSGEIFISLKNNDGDIELQVSDNGIGIPDNINIEESNTLGYQIIQSIAADQLQGKVKYDTHYGVSFKVVFSDSLYSERV